MALLSVTEALDRVTRGLEPLGAERVPLERCHGRVLAEHLAACLTQPPFDASAMDGFAVRGEDVAALPATLRLIGESAAGSGFHGQVGRGEAVRIFTGAPVPKGADTIVIQENADLAHSVVTIKEAAPARHIRPRGQDFTEGEVLLHEGVKLGSRELMLAAAMNHAELPVRRRPKVAILSTGDEVVPPGSDPGPDQIIASVSFGLAALVEAQGGEPMSLGIAKDTPESIITLTRAGSAADILVTIGGASVGERDLVSAALRSEGLELDFSKIAMRPGKPMLFGRMGSQRVLGLPGNPTSALVCAFVFLVPMVHGLLGIDPDKRGLVEAVLGQDLAANGPREHYMRGVSDRGADGERVVRPLPSQDSSLMADFARADCLIVLAPNAPALRRGERVRIIPLHS
jgi:molybdopterin molybdotransferase